MLSQQLPTRPLPVAPMPIGYCGRNRRFVLCFYVISNNHCNPIISHSDIFPKHSLKPRPQTRMLREICATVA